MNNISVDNNAVATPCCPICESNKIEENYEREEFEYGSGNKKALLNTYIPINRCAECGYEFVGHKAMALRHEAICKHLRLLTPREIQELRFKLELTQKRFADLCSLGVASIVRWEQGQLLQSTSNDVFLRLLSFPENVERLRRWNAGADMEDTRPHNNIAQFRGLGLDQNDVADLLPGSQMFTLKRKVG